MTSIVIEQNESSIREQISLPPSEIEKLYEIAQTGAKESISSLREFLGAGADIHLNCLSFLPLPVLLDRIKLYYPNHLAFHMRFSGEISGEIYTFFREMDAGVLIDRMVGHKHLKHHKSFNRIEISVLSELVNILANSFWRAMTKEIRLNWWVTPPTRVNDLSRSLTYSAKVYTLDQFLIHFEYLVPLLEIRIQLIMLPSLNTINKLVAKLTSLPAKTKQ